MGILLELWQNLNTTITRCRALQHQALYLFLYWYIWCWCANHHNLLAWLPPTMRLNTGICHGVQPSDHSTMEGSLPQSIRLNPTMAKRKVSIYKNGKCCGAKVWQEINVPSHTFTSTTSEMTVYNRRIKITIFSIWIFFCSTVWCNLSFLNNV